MAARLKPVTLAAIMVLVPTGVYLGTYLNDRSEPPAYAPVTAPVTATAPTEPPVSRPSPAVNEAALLQGRVKSLKHTKYILENEVKDNEEKLRRMDERIARAAKQQQETQAA